MSPDQKAVKIVGVLYIFQLAAAISSYSVILAPILYKNNFLNERSSNSSMVILAMVLDLLCGAAVFAIAVFLFPIL